MLATIGEIAFAYQLSLVTKQPMIFYLGIIAQFFCWAGVITTHYQWHVYEEILWLMIGTICLVSSSILVATFAFVYCFENGYKDLMVLFILHYAFCFICISLNLYNALTKKGMTTYIIQEKTPQLEDTYPSKSGSFEIEMKPIRMMSNPIHKKNVP
jgi:hypothetical protein